MNDLASKKTLLAFQVSLRIPPRTSPRGHLALTRAMRRNFISRLVKSVKVFIIMYIIIIIRDL